MAEDLQRALTLFVLLFVLYAFYCAFLHPEPFTEPPQMQIVVARYQESVDWLDQEPFNKFSVICYNKGGPMDSPHRTINLRNIGRCDHTYLYHIINNYENLAPVTLFLPASCQDPHKRAKAIKTCELALKSRNTVLYGTYHDPNVRQALATFKLEKWKATNASNSAANPEEKLQLAEIRPFGAWYDAHFEGIDTSIVCYFGIFAVSREHIRQHPVSYYKRFLDQLSVGSNPEVGHYMERSWGALFQPYPVSCIYYL